MGNSYEITQEPAARENDAASKRSLGMQGFDTAARRGVVIRQASNQYSTLEHCCQKKALGIHCRFKSGHNSSLPFHQPGGETNDSDGGGR